METKQSTYPPGDFAIWIIIYIELITFGALFLGYAYTRRLHVELFNDSQLLLDQRAGFVNTLILITSSWLVVKAVYAIQSFEKDKAINLASSFLLGSIGLGCVFLILKIIEFSTKYVQGINLSTNTFFMFYFVLTIFHFLHVLLGVIILFKLYQNTKQGLYSKQEHRGLETGASYWHMVDLLWIVLFPLIYIIR